MQRRIIVACAVVALTVAGGWAFLNTPVAQDAEAVNGSTHSEAAYTVHIDPATGKVVPPTAETKAIPLTKQQFDGLNQSDEGLVEEDSPVAGGGKFVHLQGRFQHTSVVVIGPDGKTRTDCAAHIPTNADETHTHE